MSEGNKSPEYIEIDADGVQRVLADGSLESVRWDELTEIRIATTTDGPFNEDLFWMLFGPEPGTGVALPGSYVDEALMKRFQALPGFDNEQVIAAMSCLGKAQFVVWDGMA
jgi:hypothetical protein